jgi:hypothetical protein
MNYTAALPSEQETPEIDNIGGTVHDMVGDQSHLYLAIGLKLYILSVPGPNTDPELIGEVGPLEGVIKDIAIHDNFTFLAMERGGISVIDVRTPDHPTLLTHIPLPLNPTALAAHGDHLFLAGHDASGRGRVEILDASSPEHISITASITDPLRVGLSDISVDDDRLYVAAHGDGIGVFDISDIERPVMSGWVEDITALKLAREDNELVVLEERSVRDGTGREYYITFFDSSRPGSAIQMGSVRIDANVREISIRDTVVYGQSGGSVFTVDGSNPAAPARIGGSTRLSPGATLVGRPLVYGDRLVIAHGVIADLKSGESGETQAFVCIDAGVHVLDVRDLTNVTRSGSWMLPAPGKGDVILVDNDLLFLGDGCGVRLYSVNERSLPVQLAYIPSDGYYAPMFLGRDGDRLAIIDDYLNLTVIDIADPAKPKKLGSMELVTVKAAERGRMMSMTMAGSEVAILTFHGFLTTVDVSGSGQFRVLFDGGLLPHRSNYAIAQSEHFIYAATDYGLRVIDVSDSAHPRVRGAAGPPLRALAVSGGYAYGARNTVNGATGEREGVLAVIEIGNPDKPVLVGTLERRLNPRSLLAFWSVSYHQGVAMVVSGESVVRLVDVRDPTQPRELGTIDIGATANGAGIAGGNIYVAADDAGLVVIRGALEDVLPPDAGTKVYLPVCVMRR